MNELKENIASWKKERSGGGAEKSCPHGNIILSSMANSIGYTIFLPLGRKNHIKIIPINKCSHLKASCQFKIYTLFCFFLKQYPEL